MKWISKKKKAKEIEKDIACRIMSAVCDELKDEFDYLSRQFEEDLILGAYILEASQSKKGFRQFVQDVKVLNKFENKKGKWFTIDNIFIYDSENNKYEISIEVAYGIFIGYSIDIDRIENVDTSTVNAKGFKIKYRGNILDGLFSEEELEYLNSSDIYEVELENKIYYHLFDLENGDFIGMDANKNVYEITHDPYEIVLIGDDLLTFLKKRADML